MHSSGTLKICKIALWLHPIIGKFVTHFWLIDKIWNIYKNCYTLLTLHQHFQLSKMVKMYNWITKGVIFGISMSHAAVEVAVCPCFQTWNRWTDSISREKGFHKHSGIWMHFGALEWQERRWQSISCLQAWFHGGRYYIQEWNNFSLPFLGFNADSIKLVRTKYCLLVLKLFNFSWWRQCIENV